MGKSRSRKACGIAALGLTLSSSSEAFVHLNRNGIQTFTRKVSEIRPHKGKQTISMFTVDKKPDDAFKEVSEEASSFQKAVGKLPVEAAKVIDLAAIPVAAGLGFVLTPSQKMALNLLGSTVFGVAGNFGRGMVKEERQKAAPSVLAGVLLEKGVSNVTAEEIDQIRTSFELEGEEWERVLIELYKRYLLAMMNQNDVKTSDFKELMFLAETLKMEGESVSQAHYEACSKLSSEMMLYSKEELQDLESAPGKKIGKFVFYTDRVYEEKETEEAAIFELSRLRKVLDLSREELYEKIRGVANPFYAKALEQIPKKLEKVKPETLEKARKTLGVSNRDMFEMHLSFYQSELKKIIEEKYEGDFESNALSEEDSTYLVTLQTILTLNTEFTEELFAEIAGPIYQDYLDKMLVESDSSRAVAFSNLAAISNNLCLKYEIRRDEVKRYLVKNIRQKWEDSRNLHRRGKIEEMDKQIFEMLDFFLMVSEMAKGTFRTEDYERLIEDVFKSLLRETDEQLRKTDVEIHKGFVKRRVEQGEEFTETDQFFIGQLELLLGIHSRTSEKEVLKMTGDMLRDTLYQLYSSKDLTMESKIELGQKREAQKMELDEFKKILKEIGKELYEYQVKEFKRHHEVLKLEHMDELLDMVGWFELEEEDTESINAAAFGDFYKKTILEAMGPAAVIEEESYAIFDALAKRCMLTERVKKMLFKQAIIARAVPMVESILNAWDMVTLTREQLAKKRGTDYGTDLIRAEGSLGIGTETGIIPDILTLIDFFDDNRMTEKVEVEVEDENGNKEIKTEYRHLANVKNIIKDPKLAEDIYRSFVVQAYTENTRDPKVMSEAQEKLPSIFGIRPEDVKRIKASMGGSIVDRFVINFFSSGKQNLDPNALMFLAQIQTQLKMTDKEFDELITESKAKFLKGRAQELFSGSTLGAANCKAFREQMNAMMIDPEEHKLATMMQRRQMFAIELGAVIEGNLSLDEVAELAQECQESYKLTEDDAQSALTTLMKKRFEKLSTVVMKHIETKFNQRASDGINKIVRYGLLCPIQLEHSYTPQQVQSIVNVYEEYIQRQEPEAAEEKLEALKIILGA